MTFATGTFDLKELIEEIIPFNRLIGVELPSYDPEAAQGGPHEQDAHTTDTRS